MNIQSQQIIPGRFVSITSKRTLKTYKNITRDLKKESTYQVRLGVQYDNIKNVKQKREDGSLPTENQGLSGKEWVEYPTILRSTKTGELYLRCSTIPNQPVKTKYYDGDKEISKDDVKPLCLALEFPKNKPLVDVFDIKLSDILEIKGLK